MRDLASQTARFARQTLSRLHRDERGAEGLEKLLILAAVALPLLAVLLFFGDQIREYLSDSWTDVKDNAESAEDGDPAFPVPGG